MATHPFIPVRVCALRLGRLVVGFMVLPGRLPIWRRVKLMASWLPS